MNTLAMLESLEAANLRLNKALGHTPLACSPATIEKAERIIAGDVYRTPDGQWVHIDLDNVDWNGTNTINPEIMFMFLRRFYLLTPLAAAYRATNDERYADAAARFITAYLRDDPPVDNWEPAPRDGYDIRVDTWLSTLSEFSRSPSFNTAFIGQIFQAVQGYLRYLSNNVRPDRNVRFYHGQVLLVCGFRLAGMPEAAAWQQQGIAICNDAVRRQLLPDGAHMEATPGYHSEMRHIADYYWRLAQAMPELGLKVTSEKIAAMLDYELAASRPDGAVISLHDTRYEPAVRNPTDGIAGARADFRRRAGLPATMPPCCGLFPHAGQAFIREDWTPRSCYLTFDAATRRSFHWHPSRNSITLFANGRALLVDPGYTFETKQFPRYGHRTAHHNTVNFNGWDQSDAPASLRADSTGNYTLAEGLYGGGYWPLENSSYGTGIFGRHHRSVLWIHRRFGVVLDSIQHSAVTGGKPAVETCWQLSEGPAESNPDASRVITRHATGNLQLDFALVLPGTKITMHTGERDPMRGWLPIEWGRKCIPAPLVRVVAPDVDPWHGDMATVLTPFAGATAPGLEITASGPDAVRDSRKAGCLRIRHADGAIDMLVWTRALEHAIDRQHNLETDAALVHLQLNPAGKPTAGLLVDGTYGAFEGVDLSAKVAMLDRLGI